MILYIEDAKDSTRKLLVVIHEFGKDAGFKINRHKSIAFYERAIYIYSANSNKSVYQIHKNYSGVSCYIPKNIVPLVVIK